MCSDFWPHGDVCRKYGVLRDDEPFRGAAQPAIFVLGMNRKIQFQKFYSVGEVAPLEDIVSALEGIH
jgi:alkyl hydroperoxide reductase subunit AhpC